MRGVSLPSQFSSQDSLDDARILAENLGIQYDVIPIQPAFEATKQAIETGFRRQAGRHDGRKYPGAIARGDADGDVEQVWFAAADHRQQK